MELNEDLNQFALELWEKYSKAKDSRTKLAPILYPPLHGESLLFVGLNPSFSKKGFRGFLKGTQFEKLDIETFFTWESKDNWNAENIAKAIEIEKLSQEKYGYFKKFRCLSDKLCRGWDHLDVLWVRCTNQKELEIDIQDDFIKTQIDKFILAVERLEPKMVIIANAKASSLFASPKYFNCDNSKGVGKNHGPYCDILKFDVNIGTYRWKDTGIPVFLSSMVTGQRALDTFSLERLYWHIQKTLSNCA